jgi:predicted XRE-type DNA-binding protein
MGKTSQKAIHSSSGNIFADLGISESDERLTKVKLAVTLSGILSEMGLLAGSQSDLAARLGTTQPKVSKLLQYKLDGFSVERLMQFATALSCDVDIVIRKRPMQRRAGKINVSAA